MTRIAFPMPYALYEGRKPIEIYFGPLKKYLEDIYTELSMIKRELRQIRKGQLFMAGTIQDLDAELTQAEQQETQYETETNAKIAELEAKQSPDLQPEIDRLKAITEKLKAASPVPAPVPDPVPVP